MKKTAVKDFFALKPTMVLSTRPSKSPPLSAKNDDSCSLTNIPQLNSRSSFSSTPYQCLNSIVGLSRTFSTMSHISRNMSGKDENRPSNDIEDDDNAILYTCQSFNEIVVNPRKMSNKSDKINKGSYRDATQDNEIVFEGCLLLKPKSDSASPRKFSLKSPFTTVSRNNLTDEFSSLTVLEIVREDEATTPGSLNSIGGFSSQNSSKDRHVALLESLSGKSYHSKEDR